MRRSSRSGRGPGVERRHAPPPHASVRRIVAGDLEGTPGLVAQPRRDDRVLLGAAPQRRVVEEEPQRLHQRPRRPLGREPHRDDGRMQEPLDGGEVPGPERISTADDCFMRSSSQNRNSQATTDRRDTSAAEPAYVDSSYTGTPDRARRASSRRLPQGPSCLRDRSRAALRRPANASSSGVTIRHECSTSSERMNSVESPRSASSSTRSYGSGESSANASEVREVELHGPHSKRRAGHLAPNATSMPSSGWIRSTVAFGSIEPIGAGWKGQERHPLVSNRDLGHPTLQPLPGADVERHARPPPVVDLEAKGEKGLRRAPSVDAVLVAIGVTRHGHGRARRRTCPRTTGRIGI